VVLVIIFSTIYVLAAVEILRENKRSEGERDAAGEEKEEERKEDGPV
jgi:hypothetical protein